MARTEINIPDDIFNQINEAVKEAFALTPEEKEKRYELLKKSDKELSNQRLHVMATSNDDDDLSLGKISDSVYCVTFGTLLDRLLDVYKDRRHNNYMKQQLIRLIHDNKEYFENHDRNELCFISTWGDFRTADILEYEPEVDFTHDNWFEKFIKKHFGESVLEKRIRIYYKNYKGSYPYYIRFLGFTLEDFIERNEIHLMNEMKLKYQKEGLIKIIFDKRYVNKELTFGD